MGGSLKQVLGEDVLHVSGLRRSAVAGMIGGTVTRVLPGKFACEVLARASIAPPRIDMEALTGGVGQRAERHLLPKCLVHGQGRSSETSQWPLRHDEHATGDLDAMSDTGQPDECGQASDRLISAISLQEINTRTKKLLENFNIPDIR